MATEHSRQVLSWSAHRTRTSNCTKPMTNETCPKDLPELPRPTSPSSSVHNAISFFSHLQLPPGNWACEYGGPMFLLPGLVVTWYVTETPVPEPFSIEIKRYLFARQHPEDGGWGLHIEGESSVFGTAMNYVVLRLLGASEEDQRMIKARATLHRLGGAVSGPHWAKFWLSVLGCMEWDAVNPVPPELWSVMKLGQGALIFTLRLGFFRTGFQLLHGDGGSICAKYSFQCPTLRRQVLNIP